MIWLYAVSGLSDPIWVTVVLFALLFLLSPVVLVVASLAIVAGWHAKAAATVAVICCIVITLFAVYQNVQNLHVEPLQAKPPYLLTGALFVLTLFADVAAFYIYRCIAPDAAR